MKKNIENSSSSIFRNAYLSSDKTLNLWPVLSTWVLYEVFMKYFYTPFPIYRIYPS